MTKLEQLIELRGRILDAPRYEDGKVVANVVFDASTSSSLDALADDVLEINKSGLAIALSGLRSGDVIEIRFDGHSLNYYEVFDKFLRHFPDKAPSDIYYIHEFQYRSTDSVVPSLIERHKHAVRLWEFLRTIADHDDNHRLFLLSADKLEVECVYAQDDLRDLPKLSELEAEFAQGAGSREEKRTLFKRALQVELGKCIPEKRFGALLRDFEPIYDRYWLNFRLFLEGISFEKIFEGYVEKHTKLIAEFSSVLGSIQTALIGLPIASFVILEKINTATYPTFKNTMLCFGCYVFVAFLGLLSLSQGRTLSAATTLARELNDDIKAKHPDLAKKLTPSLERLARHAKWVKWLLYSVRFLLVGLLVAATATYVYASFPAIHDSINTWLQHIGRLKTP